MSNNNKLIVYLVSFLMIPLFFLLLFIEIYSWKHPDKTNKQVTIDFFNGKIIRYFSE